MDLAARGERAERPGFDPAATPVATPISATAPAATIRVAREIRRSPASRAAIESSWRDRARELGLPNTAGMIGSARQRALKRVEESS